LENEEEPCKIIENLFRALRAPDLPRSRPEPEELPPPLDEEPPNILPIMMPSPLPDTFGGDVRPLLLPPMPKNPIEISLRELSVDLILAASSHPLLSCAALDETVKPKSS
jgi:hypothetical protein